MMAVDWLERMHPPVKYISNAAKTVLSNNCIHTPISIYYSLSTKNGGFRHTPSFFVHDVFLKTLLHKTCLLCI